MAIDKLKISELPEIFSIVAGDYFVTVEGGSTKKIQLQNVFKNVVFTSSAVLPSNTTIGSITPTELSFLLGLTSNVQVQLDNKQTDLGYTPVPNTRNINTTSPLSGGGNLTADRTLSIAQATSSVDGYLAASDFITFSNKVPSTRNINTTTPLQGGGSLSSDRTLTILQSSGSQDGYLSSTDWNTFNNKANASHTHDAADIISGTIATARLGSGTANSTTFLRGDQTWATIATASALDDLTDVTITSPSTGNFLRKSAGDWVNSFILPGDISNLIPLDGLSDVVIPTGITSGQVLRWNGTFWTNSFIQITDIPSGIDATKIGAGTVNNTEFGYLDGVNSPIQPQIDSAISLAIAMAIALG